MDIVVRTPHGDADVSIDAHAPTTTLGDVIAAVTGQAVPRLALVDDRAVDPTTLLDDVELLLGSVVTTEPPLPSATSITDVDIAQIAGHGAGRVVRLGPGRYRFGAGRRSSAAELDIAPVELAAFELVIEPTDSVSDVDVVPAGSDVDLDGASLTTTTSWREGVLTAGSRAFDLEIPARSDQARTLPTPDDDGTVTFSRPPRRRSSPDRRPVVDALHDSTLASRTLWERRPGHADAFVLPIGLGSDLVGDRCVNVDLSADRGVALAGSERFRESLARTIVVEAVTLHGPADIDLVVLTTPDRLAQWDWAKWLPHLRLDGQPAIWSTSDAVAMWAEMVRSRTVSTTTPSPSGHLTVVILDDPALWNRREAPVRPLLSNPPDTMRFIALCDDAAHAPSFCTTVISRAENGSAQLHSFSRSDDVGEFRAALTETVVAARVARALAPLVDVELPAATPAAVGSNGAVGIAELVDVATSNDILARWAEDRQRPTVAVGQRDLEPVEVALDDAVTVVVGSSIGDAFDVTATSLLAQCVECSPDRLWIVPLLLHRSPRSEFLWRLPHAAGQQDEAVAVEPRRLLARLRSLIDDDEGPTQIVIVTEATDVAAPERAWLAALADGVRATSGLALVVITDRTDSVTSIGDTVIRVERQGDVRGSAARRVATLATRDDGPGPAFAPLQPTTTTTSTLAMRPYVVGRTLTPLERRLQQRWAQSTAVPDPALTPIVALLEDAAAQRPGDHEFRTEHDRLVLPPPMPTRVDLDELFAASPGDGIPLGLVDDPSTARHVTRWWEPGSGSLLVFGSRRSGIEQVLDTISLGLVDRFTALDVRLIVVESSSTRRRALHDTGHEMRIVAPDQTNEVVDALDEISFELDRRVAARSAGSNDGPRPVVLIRDLVALRRRYASHPLGARIDEVLIAASAADSGVDVVAYASELEGAGRFATIASSRLVGASSDHDELSALGVEHPDELDGVVGRCRAFPGAELVQLAVTDAPTEALLDRRSNGDAR
jgi:S-DNA-T family DNA segregation ATPase FtsK/SpoIIIE